jgi:predicted aldo/keto reductase-like oxidoreductase
VVASEPLRSGRLVRITPMETTRPERSFANWGLRFVWNYPEVSSAISAMDSIQQIKENAAAADGCEPDSLSVQEEIWISQIRDSRRKLAPIPCASCRPCMPCPEKIDVPRIFEIYNDAFIYDNIETARAIYRNELHHAENCNACRLCENRCVKRLLIVDWLNKATMLLK